MSTRSAPVRRQEDVAPSADCRRADVFKQDCPSRLVLETLAEKWALLLLHTLAAGGPRRTSDLRRAIGGISEKMLIQTLRKLERNGFVVRHSFAEVPPRVEYRLTDMGHSLSQAVRMLDGWVEANIMSVLDAQKAFDMREG